MSEDTQVIDILKETCRNLNAGRVMFSRFRLERELGRGGMAVVWLARDLEFDSDVALKFLPGLVTDPVAERGLREEVKNTHTLVHENIVHVRDLRKDETSIAIDMEYVDGPKVSQLIAESPNCWLDPEAAGPLVRGLCRAIDYAFNEPPNKPRRLVHRDIKPLNLMVNSAGVVKVVDFGIAHSVSETIARLTNASNPKHVVGTLPYMSPQQLKGEIHHLHDVYAIGATIFELLTGTPPFRARDVATLTSQINNDVPPSMTERRRQLVAEKNRKVVGPTSVPKVWEETVAACLAKDPAERPQGAKEIAVMLGLIAGPPTHTPFTSTRKARLPAGRTAGARRWLVPAAIAVTLAVLAGAAWYFRGSFSAPPKEPAPSAKMVTTPPAPAPAATAETVPAAKTESPAVPASPPAAAAPVAPAPVAPTPTAAPAPATAPIPAPPPPPPRDSWQVIASAPTQVAIVDASGAIRFTGLLNAGEKKSLPVDQTFVIEARDSRAIAFEIDGQPVAPPAAPSGRWEARVPADRAAPLAAKESPLPFDAEVGPLLRGGQINQLEADWLRQALGGGKGDKERALVARLFEKNPTLTVMQWRAQTALEFRPARDALLSNDTYTLARAIDISLPPGQATMRLLRIEPGKYKRGSPSDEVGRDKTKEELKNEEIEQPFFAGIHEVTNRQYSSLMGKRSPSYYGMTGGKPNDNFPVEQVVWADLMDFTKRLTTRLASLNQGALVASLPTDAEWEYFCRAGTTTALNNGTSLDASLKNPALEKIAHCGKERGPRNVGELQPNAWGLYDLHGNVQEWTSDHTLRGGAWNSSAAICRSAASRPTTEKASKSEYTGFRLVLRFKSEEAPR